MTISLDFWNDRESLRANMDFRVIATFMAAKMLDGEKDATGGSLKKALDSKPFMSHVKNPLKTDCIFVTGTELIAVNAGAGVEQVSRFYLNGQSYVLRSVIMITVAALTRNWQKNDVSTNKGMNDELKWYADRVLPVSIIRVKTKVPTMRKQEKAIPINDPTSVVNAGGSASDAYQYAEVYADAIAAVEAKSESDYEVSPAVKK